MIEKRPGSEATFQLYNFLAITLRHGGSPVNLLHIFRTPFPENTSGGLLLQDQEYTS